MTPIESFEYSFKEKMGGGIIGGFLAYYISNAFGVVGTYIIDFVVLIISLVLITEKSAIKGFKDGGQKVLDSAKESNERYQEYRKLRRHLEKELHALSQGSRLERIRQAGVADLCYLAVPRGLIDPDLLLPTWGLVELFPESPRFKLIREAIAQDNVSQAGRLNIAVNIGIASGKAARFAAGIDESGKLRRPPRRRGTVL